MNALFLSVSLAVTTSANGLAISSTDGVSWTPPKTELPDNFVQATKFLLLHGLADPRGGRFCEATVRTEDWVLSKGRDASMAGWLLPDPTGEHPRFVAYDGLIYAPKKIGIELAPTQYLAGLEASRKKPVYDEHAVEPALLAALFLVHGDEQDATKAYRLSEVLRWNDAFGVLADTYMSARQKRAAWEHLIGEDAAALEDALALQENRQVFENEPVHVVGRYSGQIYKDLDGTVVAYPQWVGLSGLITDLQRRLREEPRAKLDPLVLCKLPQKKRIAALIENLDQIADTGSMVMGSPIVGTSPAILELAREGDAAVPQLLETIQKDKRLTRLFGARQPSHPRYFVPVAEAAYYAFVRIACFEHFSDDLAPHRVEPLRAFWHRFGALGKEERWYRILADDSCRESQWIEAAGRIVQTSWWDRISGRKSDGEAMPGECLRHYAQPSVSELIARRIRQVRIDHKNRFWWEESHMLEDYLEMWNHVAKPARRPTGGSSKSRTVPGRS